MLKSAAGKLVIASDDLRRIFAPIIATEETILTARLAGPGECAGPGDTLSQNPTTMA